MNLDEKYSSNRMAPAMERRRALKLIGGAAICMGHGFPALASSPVKVHPTSLDELVARLTLVIYTGRIKRQVWVSEELAKKLFMENADVDQIELKFLNKSEVDFSKPTTGFFEIDNAQPILKNPSATSLPLYRGRIYCLGFSRQQGADEADAFVGKKAIFLFDGLKKFGVQKRSFPEPVYVRAGGGHWRDALPISLDQKDKVFSIAKQAGFIVPSKKNSVFPN